jgi:hypothetical protein
MSGFVLGRKTIRMILICAGMVCSDGLARSGMIVLNDWWWG